MQLYGVGHAFGPVQPRQPRGAPGPLRRGREALPPRARDRRPVLPRQGRTSPCCSAGSAAPPRPRGCCARSARRSRATPVRRSTWACCSPRRATTAEAERSLRAALEADPDDGRRRLQPRGAGRPAPAGRGGGAVAAGRPRRARTSRSTRGRWPTTRPGRATGRRVADARGAAPAHPGHADAALLLADILEREGRSARRRRSSGARSRRRTCRRPTAPASRRASAEAPPPRETSLPASDLEMSVEDQRVAPRADAGEGRAAAGRIARRPTSGGKRFTCSPGGARSRWQMGAVWALSCTLRGLHRPRPRRTAEVRAAPCLGVVGKSLNGCSLTPGPTEIGETRAREKGCLLGPQQQASPRNGIPRVLLL